uniref:Uncharacterized protein n=1 Tax=Picea glauca TaxID=3330 RepID=A0A124GNA8_PICGL|nr:hypothetical protein ABT39_MTgene5243 [Picea glauca]
MTFNSTAATLGRVLFTIMRTSLPRSKPRSRHGRIMVLGSRIFRHNKSQVCGGSIRNW